jgi:hypothetical protein
MSTHHFVWLQSHDEVNQYLASGLGAAHGLIVQPRWLRDGLPDGDCRALVVDLDSVAPSRPALQRLVEQLSERSHSYPVAAFGYSLEDDQILDLRAAGIQVFQRGLCPAVFAAIAAWTPMLPPTGRQSQLREPKWPSTLRACASPRKKSACGA